MRSRAARVGFVLALATSSILGLAARQPASAWLGPVRPLEGPAGAASLAPQLLASSRGPLLSWIERNDRTATLKYAEFNGTGWTSARQVASGDDWFVNWADVPTVLRLPDGALVAHWLQKSGASPYAYDVRLTRSRDDGRTWSAASSPHPDGTKTEHGFVSPLAMGDGVGMFWLDGRLTAAAGHDGHGGAGAMTLRFAQFDRQGRQIADTLVDDRVCDCCPTSAAMTDDGPIVAFRNRTADEVRDIHVARLEQGRWTASRAVHDDGWRIAACPVNGPRVVASGRRVALAWFTAVGDVGRAYVAFSTDAGRTFGAPVRLDTSSTLGRVDVVWLDEARVAVSWIEQETDGAALFVRRVDVSGRRSDAVRIARLASSRASGYPRLARHDRSLLLAWTDASASTVRTATAELEQ